MKKRIFSMLLCVVMIVGLLPVTALAAGFSGTFSSDVTWNGGDVISGNVTLSGGTADAPMVVTVTGTVTVNAEIKVTGNVRITGGGTLERDSAHTTTNSYMLCVASGAQLTLENISVCGDDVGVYDGRGIYVNGGTLKIHEGTTLCHHYNTHTDGSAIKASGGSIEMNGGLIENNTVQSYGTIYLDSSAAFTFNGGVIRNNTRTGTTKYGGGAFYVRNATLTMNGGTISGHDVGRGYGGAIYCTSYGTVYLNGGSITGNQALLGDAIFYSSQQAVTSELYIGGNPLVTNSIYLDNTSTDKYPYITSTIKNNMMLEVANHEKGRIIAVGSSDYTLTEADMAKVTLQTTDGTTYYAKLDNNRLLMTDKDPGYTEKYYVTYLGNGGTGSTLDNTAYELNTNATTLANSFQREGYDFVGWNTNADGSGTPYAPGDSIPMTGDVILYAIWEDDTSDEPHSHYNCGVKNCTAEHTHSEVASWTAWDGTSVPTGNVYLSDDVTIKSPINISGTLNLCLNGKTLSAAGGYLIVASGGTLNLCSCSAGGTVQRVTDGESNPLIYARSGAVTNLYNVTLDGGAVWGGTEDSVLLRGTTNSGITSSAPLIDAGAQKSVGGHITLNGGVVLQNNSCSSEGHGGAVTLGEDGTLVINGATIHNNTKTSGQAGAIKAYAGAKITMNSGEIYGNSAATHGGAVQIFGNDSTDFAYAVLEMNGGTIRNNKAGGVGGAIAVSNNSSFAMNGGTIRGNATTDPSKRGGGVGFADADTSMSVSGSAVITDNTAKGAANNLYIGTNACNKVAVGVMTTGARVSVTMSGGIGVFSTGGASYLDYFTSDSLKYEVAVDGNNLKLAAVPTYTVTFNMNGHGTAPAAIHDITSGSKITAPAAPTAAGYIFAGWYKEQACENAWNFATDTVTDNITLYAKWTVKESVSISEDVQTYTWDGVAKSFEIEDTTLSDFTVEYYVSDAWTTIAPSAVGTYDVKVTRVEDDTYKAYEKTITGGLVINAATPDAVPPAANTLTYNGIAQKLITAGSATGGTMYYALGGSYNPTGDWSTNVPTGTDAKTYYVWYKIEGDSSHNDTDPQCISVTIDKAEVEIPEIADKVFTGETLKADINETDYYSVKNDGGINVGEYDVVLTLKDSQNYMWEEGDSEPLTLKFNITAAAIEDVTHPTPGDDLFFTNEPQELITAGSSDNGKMQYALGENENDAPTTGWSTTIPTASDAGTYYVWYKVDGGDNYNDSDPVCITVTIAPGYYATVAGGSGDGWYPEGALVEIEAEDIDDYNFDKWEVVSGEIVFDDETAAETSFVMPDTDVEVKAVQHKDLTEEFITLVLIADMLEEDKPVKMPEKPDTFGEAVDTYSIYMADRGFTDVTRSDWFYGDVTALANKGVVGGYPDGTFKPYGEVTWGEALKLVMKAVGYGDIAPTGDHWASGYLETALADLLISGEVELDAVITREEVANLTAQALKLAPAGIEYPFDDYAPEAAVALYAAGIIKGSADNGQLLFRAESTITRAEMSAIVWRVYCAR